MKLIFLSILFAGLSTTAIAESNKSNEAEQYTQCVAVKMNHINGNTLNSTQVVEPNRALFIPKGWKVVGTAPGPFMFLCKA